MNFHFFLLFVHNLLSICQNIVTGPNRHIFSQEFQSLQQQVAALQDQLDSPRTLDEELRELDMSTASQRHCTKVSCLTLSNIYGEQRTALAKSRLELS